VTRSYVTILTTPDYLPGVAVLSASLRRVRSRHPLYALVTDDLDARASERAKRCCSGVIRVPAVPNPVRAETYRHWNYTYSKLQIFGLTQFEKLVFLDADMLVCTNIDDLFERPHLSAVNAGGRLPELEHWVGLNSGLLVLAPDADQHREMLSQVGRLATTDHGDQTFLHAFFPDWPKREELHLDHGCNMFVSHMDRYATLFGYRMPTREEVTAGPTWDDARVFRVIHFVGGLKPWHRGFRTRHLRAHLGSREGPMAFRAARLWY
jgi:glycogenin